MRDGRGEGDRTKIGDMHHSLNTLPTQTSLNTSPHTSHTHSHQERKIIKNEKGCRNAVPKSTQTRKDKSDGKYTKPHPSQHLFARVKLLVLRPKAAIYGLGTRQ